MVISWSSFNRARQTFMQPPIEIVRFWLSPLTKSQLKVAAPWDSGGWDYRASSIVINNCDVINGYITFVPRSPDTFESNLPMNDASLRNMLLFVDWFKNQVKQNSCRFFYSPCLIRFYYAFLKICKIMFLITLSHIFCTKFIYFLRVFSGIFL